MVNAQIVQAEGRSDDLHDEGLKQLFRAHGQSAPMQFYVGKEIYEALDQPVVRAVDLPGSPVTDGRRTGQGKGEQAREQPRSIHGKIVRYHLKSSPSQQSNSPVEWTRGR